MEIIKLPVVVHKKTGKMLPFQFDDRTGEVIILASGNYNIDDYIVRYVPASDCDWDTGYVVEKETDIWQRSPPE